MELLVVGLGLALYFAAWFLFEDTPRAGALVAALQLPFPFWAVWAMGTVPDNGPVESGGAWILVVLPLWAFWLIGSIGTFFVLTLKALKLI